MDITKREQIEQIQKYNNRNREFSRETVQYMFIEQTIDEIQKTFPFVVVSKPGKKCLGMSFIQGF